MGFSQVAVFVVLAGTVMYGTSLVVENVMSAQQETHQAWRDAEVRSQAARGAAQDIALMEWNSTTGHLAVEAENSGVVPFDAARVEAVVDGVLRTSDRLGHTVDGRATDVWSPGTTLIMVLDLSGHYGEGESPSDLLLVTGTGTRAYWRA